ncbi:MAG TPA: sigma-70 family RNA polymerase sigma factor [Verrucomicrobiae bacterium]|nr:sigma-70 family RNA polymerase sigma factor [Verrucomicrobiae bacterium]
MRDAPSTGGWPSGSGQFTTTHWSVVVAARDAPSTQSALALEQLCRIYWYPLYAFIRRRGFDAHDAQDLTQEFFYRLLDRNYLSAVDYRKGKFRSFLLAALEHFLANEWRRSKTQKRGGRVTFVSINDDTAENRFIQAPSSSAAPEKAYEQAWAMSLLEQVLNRLRAEATDAGKLDAFEQLKGFLTGDKQPVTYAELARQMNTTEAALKMSVSRMRARYGELLRDEIAQTVTTQDEIEDELRALFAALSG